MGAYLSQPKTDKISTDEFNDLVVVGASSMQGWRNSQEDAHNSILNFDTNTSFFAVYDGHGGAEVATYCADKLPAFLKNLDCYKNGDLEKALVEAFLGFDKTLLDSEVVNILKILAGEKNYADPDDSDEAEDEEDIEDLIELHEESNLPISEVLEKYKGGVSMPSLKRLQDTGGSKDKPVSPFLRGRRAAAVIADAVNKAVMDPDAHPAGSSTSAAAAIRAAITAADSYNDGKPGSSKSAMLSKMETNDAPEEDSTVSSSSSSNASRANNIAAAEDTEAEAANLRSRTITTNGAPSSSVKSFTKPDSSHIKESDQNGGVTSSENKAIKENVSTSVAAVQSVADDSIVSGSNDAIECKKNGNVGSSSSVNTTLTADVNAGPSTISSTSKDIKKPAGGDEDSTDDDADYEAVNSVGDDKDPRHALEYSSDEEVDDDEEEDDDDDDDEEEEEDEASVLENEQFCANMVEEPGKDSGCTAVVALLCGRDLYVANAGDSRCVVCRDGKAIDMSLDHKPEDENESFRIFKAGGRVTMDGRVNGGLNLSRAIGDHAYKMNAVLSAEEQMISALPDVKKLIITPEDEFMVLACDGIWNYMSSEEVVDFVRSRLMDDSMKISQICEALFDNCLAPNTMGDGTGCDNMTAVIVRFKPKILELPTTIKPDEVENVLATKRQSLKRCASPTEGIEANEAADASKTKRLKTDEEASSISSTAAAAKNPDEKECDSVTHTGDGLTSELK